MDVLSIQPGLLFVIVGPAGVGKNALMEEALKRETNLRQLATATTRPRRPNEQDGRERLFLNVEQFQQMMQNGALLEWQEVHRDEFYGVPRKSVEDALASGQHLIADIDVLGATYIRSLYPQNVILIFVEPPSLEALESRMQVRGESDDDIRTRLNRVTMEMTYLPLADYSVINDDFEQATEQFCDFIAAEIDRQSDQRPSHRYYEHTTRTIPVYDSEYIMRRTDAPYPTVTLLPGEVPHIAALRALGETFLLSPSLNHLLRMKLNKGSFISPVTVDVAQENHTKRISFTYIYLLSERLRAGEEWEWHPLDELEIAAVVRQALQNQGHLTPHS
jgi:guanylate kinase